MPSITFHWTIFDENIASAIRVEEQYKKEIGMES
jgi:hypothetical protein